MEKLQSNPKRGRLYIWVGCKLFTITNKRAVNIRHFNSKFIPKLDLNNSVSFTAILNNRKIKEIAL